MKCDPDALRPGKCQNYWYVHGKKCCKKHFQGYLPSVSHGLFDCDELHNANEAGIRTAYYNAFLPHTKMGIYKKFEMYKTKNLINIPKYMILGSLKDVLEMGRGGHHVFKFLCQHRCFNVEDYKVHQNSIEEFKKDFEEEK